ncbi:hypothetical protein [Scytonema sp. HK-05]|nr:hypothetical protein [Scytonema sp. HK-05]
MRWRSPPQASPSQEHRRCALAQASAGLTALAPLRSPNGSFR